MSDDFEGGREFERQEVKNILQIITGVEDNELLRQYLDSWLRTLNDPYLQ